MIQQAKMFIIHIKLFLQHSTITTDKVLISYMFVQHSTVTTGTVLTMHIFLQHSTSINIQSIDNTHIL